MNETRKSPYDKWEVWDLPVAYTTTDFSRIDWVCPTCERSLISSTEGVDKLSTGEPKSDCYVGCYKCGKIFYWKSFVRVPTLHPDKFKRMLQIALTQQAGVVE